MEYSIRLYKNSMIRDIIDMKLNFNEKKEHVKNTFQRRIFNITPQKMYGFG